jgi:hypothetical protein
MKEEKTKERERENYDGEDEALVDVEDFCLGILAFSPLFCRFPMTIVVVSAVLSQNTTVKC